MIRYLLIKWYWKKSPPSRGLGKGKHARQCPTQHVLSAASFDFCQEAPTAMTMEKGRLFVLNGSVVGGERNKRIEILKREQV